MLIVHESENNFHFNVNLFVLKKNQATNLQHYDRTELELIQSAAVAYQMEIIPLIQTFGHFEWVLKLKEFAEFRDDPRSSLVISPCFDQSYVLLEGKKEK